MSVIRPRSRIISFRLAEDEYEQLRKLTATDGARSLSDYARAAVCHSLQTNRPVHGEYQFGLAALSGSVEALRRDVRQMIFMIRETVEPHNGAGEGTQSQPACEQ
jgi:hypothetical protein